MISEFVAITWAKAAAKGMLHAAQQVVCEHGKGAFHLTKPHSLRSPVYKSRLLFIRAMDSMARVALQRALRKEAQCNSFFLQLNATQSAAHVL